MRRQSLWERGICPFKIFVSSVPFVFPRKVPIRASTENRENTKPSWQPHSEKGFLSTRFRVLACPESFVVGSRGAGKPGLGERDRAARPVFVVRMRPFVGIRTRSEDVGHRHDRRSGMHPTIARPGRHAAATSVVIPGRRRGIGRPARRSNMRPLTDGGHRFVRPKGGTGPDHPRSVARPGGVGFGGSQAIRFGDSRDGGLGPDHPGSVARPWGRSWSRLRRCGRRDDDREEGRESHGRSEWHEATGRSHHLTS